MIRFIFLRASLSLILSMGFFLQAFAAQKNHISQQDVIESALKHYPTILSYYEKVNASTGAFTKSQGFFDIRFKQNYYDKIRGFYDGKVSDSLIEKELGVMGARVYGGYRKSYGNFADYDRGYATNDDGEYRVGVELSLLRNSTIDENRLMLEVSKLGIEESKMQLQKIKMQIIRDAKKAYWLYMSSGQIYKIYKGLYDLSLKRQEQLEEKQKKGAIAQIIVAENRKNILKRKTILAKARQDFVVKSFFLSLFLRDENGKIIDIATDFVPDFDFKLSTIDKKFFQEDLAYALSNRPEINLIKIQQKIEQQNFKYAENLYKPQLDLEFGASKDQGNGSLDKKPSENFINLDFSIPLQQREAKGASAESSAKLSALKFDAKLVEDKIQIELKEIITQIDNINEIYQNLKEEAALALTLEKAEREKFKHGASNFFLVNIREQDTASANAALFEIYANYQEALADYNYAIFKPIN